MIGKRWIWRKVEKELKAEGKQRKREKDNEREYKRPQLFEQTRRNIILVIGLLKLQRGFIEIDSGKISFYYYFLTENLTRSKNAIKSEEKFSKKINIAIFKR